MRNYRKMIENNFIRKWKIFYAKNEDKYKYNGI